MYKIAMVGEEVVKPPCETNALQQSAGENSPLKAKGNFGPSPHLREVRKCADRLI